MRFVSILSVFALMVHSVWAADWPQWGLKNERNMVSPETGLCAYFNTSDDAKAPEGMSSDLMGRVLWKARLGAFAYGNPTVADGRVFVGTDTQTLSGDARLKSVRGGLLKCLDEASGDVLWQLPVRRRTLSIPGSLFTHQHLGICSSPTVHGDRVYIVASNAEILCLDVNGQADGNDGPFKDEGAYMAGAGKPPVQLNAKDADIIWRFDPVESASVCPHDAASCSVLIHRGMLYTSTSNGIDKTHKKIVSPEAPALIVLDAKTGRVVARENEQISSRLYHTQWSPPSMGKVGKRELIFFGGGDGVCYAFEALQEVPDEPVSLKKVWSYEGNPDAYKYDNGELINFYRGDKRKSSSPNKNDGKYFGPNQIIATPVYHEGRVYVVMGQDPAHGRGKGLLHCIDASGRGDITKSGCVWTYDGLDRSLSTPTVAQGCVYAVDVAGRLHCVDADTGKCCWIFESGSEAWGTPLIADGKIYFGNKSKLFVLKQGKQKKLLAEMKMGSSVFSTPIAANGVLYVASNRYLWAVASRLNR